jgi:redox-sensitive bicupin YhaK (pirin superfamily)
LVRIIAGEIDADGATGRGPGLTYTPITLAHATIAPGARLDVPWNRDFNGLVYVLAGNGSVGPAGNPIHEGQLAVMGAGDRITVSASATQDARTRGLEVLLLGGRPIREPVFHYGPFVMNSKSELIQAVEDFNAGKFGTIPPNALMPHTSVR